jgi:hypothetical protein
MAVPGDYPGSYEVFISSDGTTFRGPVTAGDGTVASTVIHFSPRTMRAVRIDQTGTAPG